MNNKSSRAALVGVMPPDKTGISEFNEYVFSPHASWDTFSDSTAGLQATGKSNFRHYRLSEIYSMTLHHQYSGIAFCLGNSDHNLPTLRCLQSFIGFPGIRTRIFIHIHDPILCNIGWDLLQSSPRFGEILKTQLGEQSAQAICKMSKHDAWKAWAYHEYAFITMICSGIQVSGIVVHSNAAKDIVRRQFELFGSRKCPPIHILDFPVYHDCLSGQYHKASSTKKIYDFGIFGVMDNGGKLSNKALSLAEKLFQSGFITNGIVAGYNANEYRKHNPNYPWDRISVVDNPTNDELIYLMSATRFAFHFRASNTGESSAVVPMLISANCIPVVSAIGSFCEYPPIVIKIENDYIEEQGFDKLVSIFSKIDKYVEDFILFREAFCDERNNSKQFAERLLALLTK